MSTGAKVVRYLSKYTGRCIPPDLYPGDPVEWQPLILMADHLAELEAARESGRREGVAQRLIELKRPLAAKAKLSPAEARRLRDLDRAIAKILLGEDYREPEELTEEQQIKMAKMARAALLPSPPPPATPEDPSP